MRRFLKWLYCEGEYGIMRHVYHYNGEPSFGYILYRDTKTFGIPGYRVIDVYVDRDQAYRALEFYKNLQQYGTE